MPSSKNKQYDDVDYYEDYDDYNEVGESRWCQECQSQEIMMNGLCECCSILKRVRKHGEVNFNNDYWMSSPCDTGIALRKKWKASLLKHPTEDESGYDEELPYPVYFNEPQQAEKLLVLNPRPVSDSEPCINKGTFTWATNTVPVKSVAVSQGKTAYIPPHRRCPSP